MTPFLDIICLATSFTLQKITKRNRPFKSHHGILITDINRIRPIRCFSSRFKVTHVVDHCKQLPFKLVTPTPFFSRSHKKKENKRKSRPLGVPKERPFCSKYPENIKFTYTRTWARHEEKSFERDDEPRLSCGKLSGKSHLFQMEWLAQALCKQRFWATVFNVSIFQLP